MKLESFLACCGVKGCVVWREWVARAWVVGQPFLKGMKIFVLYGYIGDGNEGLSPCSVAYWVVGWEKKEGICLIDGGTEGCGCGLMGWWRLGDSKVYKLVVLVGLDEVVW